MAEPRWLTEADVVDALDLQQAVAAVRHLFAAAAAGRAVNMPKAHLGWDGHGLHATGAESEELGLVAAKVWAHTGGGATPLLAVWDRGTGGLVAVVEAFALGQMRTAALSAVATDALAAPDAAIAAIVGAGKQALPQAAALAVARPLDQLRVWNRTLDRAEGLAAVARAEGFAEAVIVSRTAAAAVVGADIVTTATRSHEALLTAADLAPHAHINAVGAISPERRELADDVATGAATVVADDPGAAAVLAVELAGVADIIPLSAVVADPSLRGAGRSVFKAMGTGLADLAVGAAVVANAANLGLGRAFPVPERRTPRLTIGARE